VFSKASGVSGRGGDIACHGAGNKMSIICFERFFFFFGVVMGFELRVSHT
jgi:hypothetical protein